LESLLGGVVDIYSEVRESLENLGRMMAGIAGRNVAEETFELSRDYRVVVFEDELGRLESSVTRRQLIPLVLDVVGWVIVDAVS
jgi:hypothetical protein